MAWLIKIGPTGALLDRTASIKLDDGVEVSLTYNERSTARFSTLPGYRPTLRDEVEIYEQDGVTLLFGGLVYQRQSRSTLDRITTEIDCTDWSIYGDWCTTSAAYSTDPTLQTVLDDLVDDHLAAYGVSLDGADYSGVTLAAFAWSNKTVTEALRELSTKTGYIWRFSPQKVLSLIIPGASAAPFDISDATPNCSTLEWSDTTDKYASKVTLLCGTGTAVKSIAFVGTDRVDDSGGEYSYFDVGYNVSGDINLTWPNVITVTGQPLYSGPCAWGLDGAHFWRWSWDYVTHRLVWDRTLGVDFDDAWVVPTFTFTAQYPFAVVADSGASPVVEIVQTAPDIMDYDAGLEMAEGLLARASGTQKTIEFLTLTSGLAPGQDLSIVLADRALNVPSAFLQIVDIRLVMATWWEYRVTAIEGNDYLGSYLDFYRIQSGGGGAVSYPTTGSGSIVVGGSPYYLGGSRFHAVQVPA